LQVESDIQIKGLIKSSFLDWDGKVVTTIYLPRCNFKCPFCHNWELTDHPENFENVSLSSLDRHLRENRDFLDGVCITGGEPTLYKGLSKFIRHIKDLDLLVKLDTNGTQPDLINELIENKDVDYIAMDVKAPLTDKYDQLSGVRTDISRIKKTVEILMNSKIDYEFRVTVVPTLLDESDIEELSKSLSGAKKFVFQQFVPDHARDESLRTVKPYKKEYILKLQDIAKNNIDIVVTRGLR
jgi:pyruvate formate lyase activating enzyme